MMTVHSSARSSPHCLLDIKAKNGTVRGPVNYVSVADLNLARIIAVSGLLEVALYYNYLLSAA